LTYFLVVSSHNALERGQVKPINLKKAETFVPVDGTAAASGPTSPTADFSAAMTWLSTADPESLACEYKSLYTCASRCPAMAKFKMQQLLGPFVSACINADINGIITFGVMEWKEAGVLAARHGVVDDGVWPKVVGLELNVNKPGVPLKHADVDDVCVRQQLVSETILGSNGALVVDEWDETSNDFTTAATAAACMNTRIQPHTCKVIDGASGAELSPPRWVIKVQVFGKTQPDQHYDPVRFLCRHRPLSPIAAPALRLESMILDAVVKVIEDRAAAMAGVGSAVSFNVEWSDVWADVCTAANIDTNAPFKPVARTLADTTLARLVLVQFGNAVKSCCTVNDIGQLDVTSVVVGPKKIALKQCCKQLALSIVGKQLAKATVDRIAPDIVNRDADLRTLRAEEVRVKKANGASSAEYAAAKAQTESRRNALDQQVKSASVYVADQLRKHNMQGNVPSTWDQNNYYAMCAPADAVACFRTHHGSALAVPELGAGEGRSAAHLAGGGRANQQQSKGRDRGGSDRDGVYTNDAAHGVGEIDARKATLQRHVDEWRKHNVAVNDGVVTAEQKAAAEKHARKVEKIKATAFKRGMRKEMGSKACSTSEEVGAPTSVVSLNSEDAAMVEKAFAKGRKYGMAQPVSDGNLANAAAKASGDAVGGGGKEALLPAGTRVEGIVTYTICNDGTGGPAVVRTGNSIVYKASAGRNGEHFFALKLAVRGKNLLREASTYFAIDPDKVGECGLTLLRDVAPSKAGPLLVMDWADKGTVADWIADPRRLQLLEKNPTMASLLRRRGVEYVLQAARALKALHESKPSRVHQDVKPGNLLLFDGNVVEVADLGLVATDDDNDDNNRVLGGTWGYMSPEQATLLALGRSERAVAHGAVSPELVSEARSVAGVDRPGPPCDVWALGMVLAEVLGGTVAGAVAEYRRVLLWLRSASAGSKHNTADATLRASLDVVRGMSAFARTIVDAAVRSGEVGCADVAGEDAVCDSNSNDIELLAKLLGRCFDADVAVRPSMGEFQAEVAEWYKTTAGTVYQYPKSRTAVLKRDVFRAFPTAREREAWYAARVQGDHRRAADLLEQELTAQLMKRATKKSATRRALAAGAVGTEVLCSHPSVLEGGKHDNLLPLVMEWVAAVCRRAASLSSVVAEEEVNAGGAKVVERAGALLRQLQAVWLASQRKRGVEGEECCSRQFGSSGDFFSPVSVLCKDVEPEHERVLAEVLRRALVGAPDTFVNHRDKGGEGMTPLFIAAENRRTAVVRLLLRAGAGVNTTNKSGEMPLHIAVHEGHAEVVQLLLGAGADVNAAVNNGATPLNFAAQKGHTEIVQLLLGADANVSTANNDGVTPLYIAAQQGHTEIVQLLLGAGANVNTARNDGATPLNIAAQNGHTEVRQLLLSARVDGHALSKDGASPLTPAAKKGHAH
jgi:ankyrin repeat protein/serine/threonine protein kinase